MLTNSDAWIVYGSELSPFTLKLILLCKQAGLAQRFLPTEAGALENLRVQRRLKRLLAKRLPLTWPIITDEDEFPLVPYLFGPKGENLYDSTAIAEWLDKSIAPDDRRVIPDDPATAFIVRLIDDYADEFGLYMVHHYRWNVSARDNNAGRRLAHEWRSLLGPLQRPFAAWFSTRQVRRLPYLFSIASADNDNEGLLKSRIPPSRLGFPATQQLLETAFERLLDCLETLLKQQPYLLGGRFTLADAAIYGQLAMNLDDPSAQCIIRQRAPSLYVWLRKLRDGRLPTGDGKLAVTETLAPLLAEICRTHIPLMQQNLAACEGWLAQGENLFNEAAFNRGLTLYDGILDGQPFRHVAKRFQAKTWRQCKQRWLALPVDASHQLQQHFPELAALIADPINVKLVSK